MFVTWAKCRSHIECMKEMHHFSRTIMRKTIKNTEKSSLLAKRGFPLMSEKYSTPPPSLSAEYMECTLLFPHSGLWTEHFVLAVTHESGWCNTLMLYVGICLAFMPLASCVRSNTPPLGEHWRRTLGSNPRPHEWESYVLTTEPRRPAVEASIVCSYKL